MKSGLREKAEKVFDGSGVTISTEGERHMGAVIGSEAFKKEYVSNKVSKWAKDIEMLADIAKDNPQAAYVSYTKAVAHRWTFMQRTIPGINHLFQPLESVLREKLIPTLVGKAVTDLERKILALPVRLGGIGISDPSQTAQLEFDNSSAITADLSRIIYNQEKDFTNFESGRVEDIIKQRKTIKDQLLKDKLDEILTVADPMTKRILELNQEKGAGAWLTAIPLKSLGFTLNKQEFKDSMCLRYGWRIPNTPSHCQCGEKNTIDHALMCKKGGYVCLRHNRLRDLEAELMREVCSDVRTEPALIPIANKNNVNGNTTDQGRPDVSGVGVWSPME